MDGKTHLVVGATGATGRLLVEQLLDQGHRVKAIVRAPERVPAHLREHPGLDLHTAEILAIPDDALTALTADCSAIHSCLGHNMTFRGVYGKPRRLVRDAVARLCGAALRNKPEQPVKFILMNTAGNRNRDLMEPISFGQRLVVGAIRLLIPPHADNEQAADHLRVQIGQDHPQIEWAVVRPGGLIDTEVVTDYEMHASPTRSAIFNAGKTSRIHVAHFMAALATDDALWQAWRGQMPVLYDSE